MLPLCLADQGEPLLIRKIGGDPETRKHLESLGFHIGSEICIISALGQNLIVKVKESRIAVNDDLARKIMV